MVLVQVPVWKLGVSLSWFPLRQHQPDTLSSSTSNDFRRNSTLLSVAWRTCMLDSGHARQEEVFIGPRWIT